MNKITNYSTQKLFIRLLTNKSKANYWNYIIELRKRKTNEIFKKSIVLTQSNSIKERIIGINILAQFGQPRQHKKEIIQIFFKLLQSETNKYVISAVFFGIGHNNEKLTNKQVNILTSFQKHKSTYVRYSLVFALCTIQREQAIDTLIYLSNDRDVKIRDWATFGLGSQIDIDTEKIRKALWNRVSDKDETVKTEAIWGLAQRKDDKIKSILEEELNRLDDQQSIILEAIIELNDKSFIPILEKKIEQHKDSKMFNERWLVETLNKLKQE